MSIDKELQKELSECLAKIDSLRSQLEDLNYDLYGDRECLRAS